MARPRGLGAGPAPTKVDINMTGDEAYQRRLAMSQGFKAPSSSTPQFTSSPAVPPPSSSLVPQPSVSQIQPPDDSEEVETLAPARAPVAQSGEEAYLRRLAMSQNRTAPVLAAADPVPLVAHPASPPFVAQSPEPPALAYNPFAPPSSVPPPPTSLPPSLSDEKVRSSREAAAAIAAKLRALAPPPGSADPDLASNAPPEDEAPAPSKKYVPRNFKSFA